MVKISEDAPVPVKQKLINLVNEYKDCFAMNLKEFGCTNKIKMVISGINVPVMSKLCKTIPSAEVEFVEKKVSGKKL